MERFERLLKVKESFSLEKWAGKKHYFLGARDLNITWGDTPQYWKWTSLPESRYSKSLAIIFYPTQLTLFTSWNMNLVSLSTLRAFSWSYCVELNKRFAFLVPEGRLQWRNGYEESIYTLPYDAEDDPGLLEDDYEESVYTPPSNVDRYWREQHLPILGLNSIPSRIRPSLLCCEDLGIYKPSGCARDLNIAWSDTPQYWKWTSLPESRYMHLDDNCVLPYCQIKFPEVVKLKHVVLLDIQVKVRAGVQSPQTSYAAYLVYKFEELGVFYTKNEDGCIEIHVQEVEGGAYQEESLIVEGIELRPRMG
ncbi:hypothetical protein HAX54_016740 [Datura stramonium]|uniref:F-box protein n=1 Tax=Datura stramonium TaxID=4076 RepID=A0ABS8ULR9_DATST|nr:hypothetical protein [Datura stramonium]